ALHRDGRIEADAELGILAIEELTAHAIAIRLQELPAIHEVRDWDRIRSQLVGAAIVWKHERTDAEARLPERHFFRVRTDAHAGHKRYEESLHRTLVLLLIA